MKKKLLPILICAVLCTGCGNTKSNKDFKSDAAAEYVGEIQSNEYYQSYDYGVGEEMLEDDNAYYTTEAGMSGDAAYGDEIPQPANEVTATLKKEMLIYKGGIEIDTLDFNTSVKDFKTLINSKGGFVENETYTDTSPRGSHYEVDPDEKYHVYSATVRIPSTEYEAVMDQSGSLGDVRNKYSNATNVTQQYGTYKSQLEVYEAQYARYLALLESATEDEYALMIENELFDIQMQIATLKSNITNIENDVAYSYIDIEIREVSKYEEAPAKTDTFGDRFKNTCKESWKGFLGVLEDILFYIITNIYYIVIIAIIIIVAICSIKRVIKKYKNKIEAEENKLEVNKSEENESAGM